MEVTEIVLLVAGGVIFILSFLIPDRRDKSRNGKSMQPMAREEVRMLIGQEMDTVREHVDDEVNEAVTYAMEKTERSLERLSNEKIMAINEYSDTVLSEIHRNHEEAMFLYDMLNSKHANLKDTVSKVTQTVKEAEETVSTFQKLAPEPVVVEPVFPQLSSNEARASVLKPGEMSSPASKSGESLLDVLLSAAQPMEASAPVSQPVEVPSPALNPPEVSVPAYSAPKAAFVREAEEEMAKKAVTDSFLRPEVEIVPPAEEKISGGINSNDRILQLNQQGMDVISIAKELGLGVGEVKLVIDLFFGGNQGK